MENNLSTIKTVNHPLEPLTAEEIKIAVAIIKKEKSLDSFTKFVCVTFKGTGKTNSIKF